MPGHFGDLVRRDLDAAPDAAAATSSNASFSSTQFSVTRTAAPDERQCSSGLSSQMLVTRMCALRYAR